MSIYGSSLLRAAYRRGALHRRAALAPVFQRPVDVGLLSTGNLVYCKEVIAGGRLLFSADRFISDRFTLNIERACQAAIDMAMHRVASAHLGIPQSSGEAFTLLEQAGCPRMCCGGSPSTAAATGWPSARRLGVRIQP